MLTEIDSYLKAINKPIIILFYRTPMSKSTKLWTLFLAFLNTAQRLFVTYPVAFMAMTGASIYGFRSFAIYATWTKKYQFAIAERKVEMSQFWNAAAPVVNTLFNFHYSLLINQNKVQHSLA